MRKPTGPTPPSDNQLAAYLDRCRALIKEHGHMVQSVFPDAHTHVPGFAYTIGLSQSGGAELVTIGLPADTATYFLNTVAQRLATTPIADHDDITEIANTALRLRTIPCEEMLPHMRVARALLIAPRAIIRQVIWPDPSGRFPGDPAYKYQLTQSPDELISDRRAH